VFNKYIESIREKEIKKKKINVFFQEFGDHSKKNCSKKKNGKKQKNKTNLGLNEN